VRIARLLAHDIAADGEAIPAQRVVRKEHLLDRALVAEHMQAGFVVGGQG